MTDSADLFAEWWFYVLAEWSLRWGTVLLLLWIWFTIRAPRRAAVRYVLLCAAVLAGVFLPLVPRWGAGILAVENGHPDHQPALGAASPAADARSAPEVTPTAAEVERTASGREQSATREVGRPAAPSPPSRELQPSWRTTVFAVWLAGVLICIVRLVTGWSLVLRVRRGSTPLGRAAHHFEELRRELRIRRRPLIAQHAGANSPLLIGGWRPMVLVPAGWETLPENVQRDCLIHELSHLARGDDWARLFLEWLRAVFFFHPLVHWLAGRCRQEQELLSDECVVRRGADPGGYARTLGDFARRAAFNSPFASRWAAPALPFVNRSTAVLRIRKLLDEPVPAAMTRLQRARLGATVVLAIAFAIAMGSTRLTAVEPQAESPAAREVSDKLATQQPGIGPEAESKPAEKRADKELRLATARAILFLREAQKADGSWNGPDRWRIGATSLCTLALLRSGVPADDPDASNALAWLAAAEPPTMVYELSLQTLAFCAADPKQYSKQIQRSAEQLAVAQIKTGESRGGWSYGVERGRFLDLGGDRSNSEFALWALDEAVRAGAKVDAEVWRRAYEYWTKGQNADGGWGYTGTGGSGSPSTGSMTTSGIASIRILATQLAEAERAFVPEEQSAARAWDWMARHFTVRHNPASSNWLFYYLMTLRRAADLSERREVGRHDWYQEGKEFLMNSQNQATGAWEGVGSIENAGTLATPMALLFLNPPPELPEGK